MRRALLLLALTSVALLAVAPLGLAGSGSHSDPSGDLYRTPTNGVSAESVDIVRATFGHRRGKLVHTITTAGAAADPARGGEVPMLWIESPQNQGGDSEEPQGNGTAECTWFIGRFEGRIGVFTCGYGDRVASARVTRTSARTVRFEFSPKAIGNTRTYEWAALTQAPAGGTRVWVDRLPDGDHSYFVHTLR